LAPPGARVWLCSGDFLFLIGALVGLGIVVTGGLALFVGRSIANPIVRLENSLAAFRAGQLGARVDLRTGDEIERLAAEFNRMAAQLEQSYTTLEERVRERTEALTRANQELEQLQAFNAALIQGMPSSLLVFDRDLRLVYANDTFFQTWQYPREVLGQTLAQLLPSGVLASEGWEAMIRQVLESGEPLLERKMSHDSPTRGRTVVRLSLFRLGTPGNERAILILQDITEQHFLELQLLQSEKLAALGQLSAGIAHEIRNPLNAINMAAYCVADILQSDPHTPWEEVRPYLDIIRRNVGRADKVISEVLQFARPSGSDPTAVDLNELLRAILSILDKSFVARGIEVQTQLNGGAWAYCRPDTAKQALLNIIVNSLQAMSEGGVLTLRTFYDPAQQRVCAEIGDTGTGIPPENLPNIFNPFFTTKEPGEGTGLGLSIARSAIEAEGGRIRVDSRVGGGTVMTVQFPAAPPAGSGEGRDGA
jgi:signal transduction histidine kinase